MALIISILEQGLIYSIMALGMYITYKILDFPDMTVDGGFPFGVVLAVVMIRAGVPPILTLPICFAAGCGIGTLTGLINVKCKVRDLLAGIIMMTALYSVNLKIAGRANLPMYDYYTIFDNTIVNTIFPNFLQPFKTVIILIVIMFIVKWILDWYMNTKSGFMLRAVGDNDVLVTSMGVDKGYVRIVGLAIANGLAVEDINLGMITVMKQEAGIHSEIIGNVIDVAAESIRDDEDLEIYTSGANNIFKYPELSDNQKASELINTFEDKSDLTSLVEETLSAGGENGIQVYIGNETPVQAMKDCSVVTATYELGEGMRGTVGIIGPKRMDYDRVVNTLKDMMHQLDTLYRKK